MLPTDGGKDLGVHKHRLRGSARLFDTTFGSREAERNLAIAYQHLRDVEPLLPQRRALIKQAGSDMVDGFAIASPNRAYEVGGGGGVAHSSAPYL